MENEFRFDLNTALESWRDELAAQPRLTPDDRRELEKHLSDSMTELRGRGLSDEESFCLAQKRIGRLEKMAEESEKAGSQKVRRERAFWMVLAMLALSLWTSLVSCIQLHHWATDFWERLFFYPLALSYFLPIIILSILLARGHAVKSVTAFAAIFRTRWHFAISVILFVAMTHGWQAFEDYRFRIQGGRRTEVGDTFDGFPLNQLLNIGFPLMLLAAVIWLLPTQRQQPRTLKSS